MKTLLKSLALLFALPICALANFPSPAAADSTADLILSLKCGGGYNLNVFGGITRLVNCFTAQLAPTVI